MRRRWDNRDDAVVDVDVVDTSNNDGRSFLECSTVRYGHVPPYVVCVPRNRAPVTALTPQERTEANAHTNTNTGGFNYGANRNGGTN